jgi:hypothetical protein
VDALSREEPLTLQARPAFTFAFYLFTFAFRRRRLAFLLLPCCGATRRSDPASKKLTRRGAKSQESSGVSPFICK